MGEPRVFTIPVGVPFLPVLADAILDGTLTGAVPRGLALADVTVLLPTRRAVRALGATLAERAGGSATLLPRILPLGDLGDEDDRADPDSGGAGSALGRRLVLARLVQAFTHRIGGPASPGLALTLAAELEGLMDAIETEDAAWSDLAGLVGAEFSKHFAQTLDFVRIAHEAWPAILAGLGAEDPARRRKLALLERARRIAETPSEGPLIAAGSTGSMPATAMLLAAIARRPDGAVVLPGLEQRLDEAAWRAIGEPGGGPAGGGRKAPEPAWGHPQFMLKRLLATIGIDRGAVRPLGPVPAPETPPALRARLLSEVMRPAGTTEAWAGLTPMERELFGRSGCEGVCLIQAADEREEALAIAVALREALAIPGRTAALVTPDRSLARRVAVELGRWGVVAADSAPVPLGDLPAGRLARLSAEAAAARFAPLPVLALLAHPAVTLGLDRAEVVRAAAALEIGVLRGPATGPGLEAVVAALALRHRERGHRDPLPRQNLAERDWSAAADILRRLAAAFAGFAPASEDGREDLVALAGRHAATVARLVAGPGQPPPSPDHAALLDLFDALSTMPEQAAIDGRFDDYPVFLTALLRARTLPPDTAGAHPRLRILGPLEARLIEVDRIVLGGLDEGIWPPNPAGDAFLNRPMRTSLGLSPPERRIGQAAHDFVEALGTSDAILSRARKRDGKPTVPSRFLERLRAVLGTSFWEALGRRGDSYLAWAAALEAAPPSLPAGRPAPRPGPERFPRAFSVTEVETLVRDPYAVYARRILRLTPLDAIGMPASLAERGTLLHGILAEFAAAHPDGLPANAEADLLQRGLDAFAGLRATFPELYALWWPDFARIVPRYLDWEAERRVRFPARRIETRGTFGIPFGPESLTVSGRADRVEIGDGAAAIVDFKTGTPPTDREIAVGFSPQLTLEAAILMAGGFGPDIPTGGVPEMLHVKLGGRAGLVARPVAPPRQDRRSMAAIVEAHVAGLAELARRYGLDGEGYRSRPYPKYASRNEAYDHLARVREWSGAADPDGTEP